MSSNWYVEIDASEHISQGDIFLNGPIFTPIPTLKYSRTGAGRYNDWGLTGLNTNIGTASFVVMNQACDLERDPPETVIVAQLHDMLSMELEEGRTRKSFVSEVHAGKRPNYSIIGEYSGEFETIRMTYQIVDFSSIFTLPYALLADYSQNYGPRLRLNTPHRELLSQQFGYYYSRIGLPNEDFINKKQLEEVIKEAEKDS
ncbi:hypothetical protein [Neobacillus sp. DY30]|uniref:hypothetical protein n=1 Tax=Neobacillus sp. DY30 TaxID=3047871 RepID=UPI0024BFF797|nr:hypothetical protein [Neobacillus sp. DY30]WHY01354.1 hypothetical protein QNH29_03625 [Neobacillus sp. DY30]